MVELHLVHLNLLSFRSDQTNQLDRRVFIIFTSARKDDLEGLMDSIYGSGVVYASAEEVLPEVVPPEHQTGQLGVGDSAVPPVPPVDNQEEPPDPEGAETIPAEITTATAAETAETTSESVSESKGAETAKTDPAETVPTETPVQQAVGNLQARTNDTDKDAEDVSKEQANANDSAKKDDVEQTADSFDSKDSKDTGVSVLFEAEGTRNPPVQVKQELNPDAAASADQVQVKQELTSDVPHDDPETEAEATLLSDLKPSAPKPKDNDLNDLFGVDDTGDLDLKMPGQEDGEEEPCENDTEVDVTAAPKPSQPQQLVKRKVSPAKAADDNLKQLLLLETFCTEDGHVDMNNFLSNAAAYFVKQACDTIEKESLGSMPSDISLASLCSGSGAGELAFEAAVTALANHFVVPLASHTVLCCEKEGWKQGWLATNIATKDSICIFDDVISLGLSLVRRDDGDVESPGSESKPGHMCSKHQKSCNIVPSDEVFLLKSGFSCKGNSRMSPKFAELKMAFKNDDPKSCSRTTFVATVQVIAALRPKIFVLENVETMGTEANPDSNMSEAMGTLRSLNDGMYAVHNFTLAADDYLLPQTRSGFSWCFYRFLIQQWLISIYAFFISLLALIRPLYFHRRFGVPCLILIFVDWCHWLMSLLQTLFKLFDRKRKLILLLFIMLSYVVLCYDVNKTNDIDILLLLKYNIIELFYCFSFYKLIT